MKPSAAKNAANTGPASSSVPPPAPAASGVTDELKTIDAAPLERLLEIRKEEKQLEQYRARADQMKEQVQDVVWRRVMNDYAARESALEEQARPLEVQVRAEYQKLRALLDRTKALDESAKLEKSELEFRHAVGELTKKQLEEKLKGPTDVLERCRVDLAAIDEQKTRFLSAFATEAELEKPVPAAPPARSEPPAPPEKAEHPPSRPAKAASSAPEADATVLAPNPLAASEPDATMLAPNPLMAAEDATMLAQNPLLGGGPDATVLAPHPVAAAEAAATMLAKKPDRAAAKPAPPATEAEADATAAVSAEQVAALSQGMPGPAPSTRPAPPPPAESDDRTFMLPAAGLVVNAEGSSPKEYRLAAMNYVGRSDESHVVIARPGVSRKHALITAGVGGFSIRDLESQNGTYVNGQRVTETSLKDGDQIVIGDTKIVFRMPWPAGAARAKA